MRYDEEQPKIPAAAISTNDAEHLSNMLRQEPELSLSLRMSCSSHQDKPSHNVVGEIRGTEFPDKYIVVGGHLDSWDTGEGAHDDGAGVVQSIEVLRLFKKLGIKPRHSIRAVLFMNEENGARGAHKYAELAKKNQEEHIAALESDRGGFTPRGFTFDGDSTMLVKLRSWLPLLKPYGLTEILPGYGGVDIYPLKKQGTPLIGYLPDSQRYFDYHHSEADVFEAVNQRELELGAAGMASLIYLIDRHGLE